MRILIQFQNEYFDMISNRASKPISRRSVLSGIVAMIGGVGGCVSSNPSHLENDNHKSGSATSQRPEYHLSLWPVPVPVVPRFMWEPVFTYGESKIREKIDRHFRTGNPLTTVKEPLTTIGERGTERFAKPSFIDHEGEYYRWRLRRTDTQKRKRWVFWFELLESEPPEDATVVAGVPNDLSANDTRVVESEIEDLKIAGPSEYSANARDWAYVFTHFDPDESDLVPDPSFYLRLNWEGDVFYFEPKAEHVQVEIPTYTYGSERVASSRSGLKAYIDEEVFRYSLSPEELSEDAVRILDDSIEGSHLETTPLSSELETILERLHLQHARPDGYLASYQFIYIYYRGDRYEVSLDIGQSWKEPATERLSNPY